MAFISEGPGEGPSLSEGRVFAFVRTHGPDIGLMSLQRGNDGAHVGAQVLLHFYAGAEQGINLLARLLRHPACAQGRCQVFEGFRGADVVELLCWQLCTHVCKHVQRRQYTHACTKPGSQTSLTKQLLQTSKICNATNRDIHPRRPQLAGAQLTSGCAFCP